ncbi:2Fe-2S iron-sulfur cluster-binding protein [Thioalkalivibrio sp. HK1]|uniref:2Fe-2S iron-sulfur cluster-binding protein n=1 Tax=Thioalkalivibrio sp. HK1 TaxID=1469245 RepID=UPI0004713D39|nr:2Fe-2S iron-sulfur cluster-binding protein [Thioalkalivibrio sp. HK1]
MARFYPLETVRARKITRQAVEVTLRPVGPGDFAFVQGQYLTFRREFDGIEIRRSYSICAGRNEGVLQVGIKRVPSGVFSAWAFEHLVEGTIIEAMEPAGSFDSPLEAGIGRHRYLAFAAGSGITPVISIIKTRLAAEPGSEFTLIYANRHLDTVMFKEELDDLKNTCMARLNIVHILRDAEEDALLSRGRIDAEKCDLIFDRLIDPRPMTRIYLCGTEPLMDLVAGALSHRGVDRQRIRRERFVAGSGPVPLGLLRAAPAASSDDARSGVSVSLTLDGVVHGFEIPKGQTLLDAALERGLDMPYACRAGVCSTCKCRLVEGEVRMRVNHALEDDEVEQGFVLACQTIPLGERLAVICEN